MPGFSRFFPFPGWFRFQQCLFLGDVFAFCSRAPYRRGTWLDSDGSREQRAHDTAVAAFHNGLWSVAELDLAQFVQKYSGFRAGAPGRPAVGAGADPSKEICRCRDPAQHPSGHGGRLTDDYTYWLGEARYPERRSGHGAATLASLSKNLRPGTRRLRWKPDSGHGATPGMAAIDCVFTDGHESVSCGGTNGCRTMNWCCADGIAQAGVAQNQFPARRRYADSHQALGAAAAAGLAAGVTTLQGSAGRGRFCRSRPAGGFPFGPDRAALGGDQCKSGFAGQHIAVPEPPCWKA